MRARLFALTLATLPLLISCEKDEINTNENVDLNAGLIAWFPFNGNTNDESVNNNHGSLLNGATLSYDINGNSSSALNVTGAGQKMLVPNDGSIDFDNEMTVSFYAMPRTSGRSNILGMTNHSTGKGTRLVIGPATPGNPNLIYSLTSNVVTCNDIQTSGQVTNIDAGKMLQPESWYHVLCTYNKGVMKMYINGTLINTVNSPDNIIQTCASAQLLVGAWWSGDPSASFNGKVDDVRIYDRELNADEIEELAKEFL